MKIFKKLLKKELPPLLKEMLIKPKKPLKKSKKELKKLKKKLMNKKLKKKLKLKELKNSLLLSPNNLILKSPLVKLMLYLMPSIPPLKKKIS